MGRIKILSGVLLVQLLLVLTVWLPDNWTSQQDAEVFLDFDPAQVSSIEIDADGQQLTIGKAAEKNNRWWLAALDLPASAEKASDFLDKLKEGSNASWPVTTSSSAHERFSITEDAYERLITLKDDQGEVLVSLYLGSSPGFSKVHARKVDEDEIYAITFHNYEASSEQEDWLDKGLLRSIGLLKFIARKDDGQEWSVKLDNKAWKSTTTSDPLDHNKLDTYADHFQNLDVYGLAEKSDATEALRFRLIDDMGTYDMTFFKPEEEDDMVVESSRLAQPFRAASYLYDQLQVNLDEFKPPPPTENAETNNPDDGLSNP